MQDKIYGSHQLQDQLTVLQMIDMFGTKIIENISICEPHNANTNVSGEIYISTSDFTAFL